MFDEARHVSQYNIYDLADENNVTLTCFKVKKNTADINPDFCSINKHKLRFIRVSLFVKELYVYQWPGS